MSPLRFVAAVLLIAAALAAVVTDDAKPKTECEKQALKAVKKDPAGGRILARGEDISDLSRLEGAYGKGRWCKVVYRKSDECSQTCALLNYFWEKKSGQVVDMAFDRTFKAPGPCEPKKQQQEQGQRQRQQWNQRQQPQGPSEDEGENYYEILGIEKDATTSDIKKAYRKLAMKWHPDKNQGEHKEKAEEMFKKISEAYQTLSDDEKRKQYDTFGKQGMGGGGPGSGFHANFDPRDMFKTFFKTEEGAGDSFFSEFFQSGGDGGGNTMHFSFTTSGPAGGGGAGGMPDMGNIFGNIFGGEGGDPFGGAGAGMFGGEGADLGSMFRQAGASGKKRRGAGANPFGNAQARKPGKQAGGRPRSQ